METRVGKFLFTNRPNSCRSQDPLSISEESRETAHRIAIGRALRRQDMVSKQTSTALGGKYEQGLVVRMLHMLRQPSTRGAATPLPLA